MGIYLIKPKKMRIMRTMLKIFSLVSLLLILQGCLNVSGQSSITGAKAGDTYDFTFSDSGTLDGLHETMNGNLRIQIANVTVTANGVSCGIVSRQPACNLFTGRISITALIG